jgi:peptide/nickel transport system substrate-binding protein
MTRAIRKEPPDKGGWNAIVHGWSEMDILDPLMNPSMQANCEKARPGWPCDPKIEELRHRYAREADPAERKKTAEALQAYAMESVPYVPLGEWYGVTALGRGVGKWLNAPVPVYWNVNKD